MISAIQRRLGPFIVTIFMVICLSFLFYTSVTPSFNRQGADRVSGKIDGRNVTAEMFNDSESASYVMAVLKYGMISETGEMRKALLVEAWRRLLLLSAAKEMDVRTTDQEVVDFIQNRRLFQKDGVFQPDLYNQFKHTFLERRSIPPQKFEDMVRDEITIEKLERLIVSPVLVTPEQVNEAFSQGFSKTSVSWILFDPKEQASKATVTPAEVEAAYKEGIESTPAWRTKERRQVSYVRFELAPEEQKLTGPAKDAARQKLAEKALAFAQALSSETEKGSQNGFTSEAQKQQVAVSKTSFFARDEAPAPLPPSPNFNLAAFHLMPDRPISSVVETDRGFFILLLEEIQPSQPRPLDEVKGLVEQEIKNRKSLIMTVEAGRAAAATIKSEMDKGVSFDKAAAALKLKVEALPAVVPADPRLKDDMQLRLVRGIALSLPLHGTTGFLPTGDGGVIATVESRQPPEAGQFTDFQAQLQNSLLSQSRETALEEWLRQRSESKGTVEPLGLYSKQ